VEQPERLVPLKVALLLWARAFVEARRAVIEVCTAERKGYTKYALTRRGSLWAPASLVSSGVLARAI